MACKAVRRSPSGVALGQVFLCRLAESMAALRRVRNNFMQIPRQGDRGRSGKEVVPLLFSRNKYQCDREAARKILAGLQKITKKMIKRFNCCELYDIMSVYSFGQIGRMSALILMATPHKNRLTA